MSDRQSQLRDAQRKRRERLKEAGVKSITIELSDKAQARLKEISAAMFGESRPSSVVEHLLTSSSDMTTSSTVGDTSKPSEPESDDIAKLEAEVASLRNQLADRKGANEVTTDQLMAAFKRLLPPKVVERLNSEATLYSIVLAGLGQNRDSIRKMLDKFTQKESKAAAQVLMAVLEYQNQVFKEIVKTETPTRIQQMEAELQAERQTLARERQEVLAGKVAVPAHMMSVKDAKIIKGVLHPDKLKSLTEEKMNAAFLIFQRIYG